MDFISEERKDSCEFAGYAKLFCVLCYLFCRFATFAREKILVIREIRGEDEKIIIFASEIRGFVLEFAGDFPL